MYTQCPACRTIFEVDEDALQASLGIVRCGNCGERFDALRTLSDAVPAGPESILPERDPETFAPVLTQRVAPPGERSAAADAGLPAPTASRTDKPPTSIPNADGAGDAQLAARAGGRARALIAEAAGIARDALLEDPAWQVTELPVLTAIILQDPISPADLDDAAGMLAGTAGAAESPVASDDAFRADAPPDAAAASMSPSRATAAGAPAEAPARSAPAPEPRATDAPVEPAATAPPADAIAPAAIPTTRFLLVEDVPAAPDAPEPASPDAGTTAGVPPDPPLPEATDVPTGASECRDPSSVIPAQAGTHSAVAEDGLDSGPGSQFGSESGMTFLRRADEQVQGFADLPQSVPNAPAEAATPTDDAAPSNAESVDMPEPDAAPGSDVSPVAAISAPVAPDDTPESDSPAAAAALPDAAVAESAVPSAAPHSGGTPPESLSAEEGSGSSGVASIADEAASSAPGADLRMAPADATAADAASAAADAAATPPEPLYVPPRARRIRRGDWVWVIGCIALALALALQLAWAQRADFVRNPGTRAWALGVCARIACRLPPISDPAKLVLVSRDIRPDPQHAGLLAITATIRNDAPFRQPWPVVVVRMTDIDDRVVAMRRFRPADYQPDAARRAGGIPPQTTAMVAFDVRDPGRRATGFRFDFE